MHRENFKFWNGAFDLVDQVIFALMHSANYWYTVKSRYNGLGYMGKPDIRDFLGGTKTLLH